MGVSHSRLSGMDASAMHSRIGEADAAVTIGGVGLGSEVIRELTAGSANVGPRREGNRDGQRYAWTGRLDSSYLLQRQDST
jgi:hypothetical protein